MDFICKRCGFYSNKLINYKHHLSRKHSCKDKNKCGKTSLELLNNLNKDLDFKCLCGECFASKQGYHQHASYCTFQSQLQRQLELQKVEIESLKETIHNLQMPCTTNNNTTNNRQSYNQNEKHQKISSDDFIWKMR